CSSDLSVAFVFGRDVFSASCRGLSVSVCPLCGDEFLRSCVRGPSGVRARSCASYTRRLGPRERSLRRTRARSRLAATVARRGPRDVERERSEEHTSELQ